MQPLAELLRAPAADAGEELAAEWREDARLRQVRAVRRRARRAHRRPHRCSTGARPTCACRAARIDLAQASTDPEARGTGVGRALTAHVLALGPRAGLSGDDDRLADDEPLGLALLAEARLPRRVPAALPLDPVVQRIPLLYGTRLTVVDAPDDAVVLRPPPPGEPVADVRAAVRDALRFPLAGDPLEALVTRGGRATIVVEPPALPLPGALERPAAGRARSRVGRARARRRPDRAADAARRDRPDAPAAAARARAARRRLTRLRAPLPRRGRDPRRREPGARRARARRAHARWPSTPRSSSTDLVADRQRGRDRARRRAGAAARLPAAPRRCARRRAYSLLETGASQGWRLALAARAPPCADRVPVIGVSLVLDQPRLGGAARGYPYEPEAVERIASSPLRRGFRRSSPASRATA